MKKKIEVPRLLNVSELAYSSDIKTSDLYNKLDGRTAWRAKELEQVKAAIKKHAKETAAMLKALEG